MAEIIAIFEQWGLAGLVAASFAEALISPVLPDILLIPMALAAPEKAIYYAAITTMASVAGGLAGYLAGSRFGMPLMERFVPRRYTAAVGGWLERYGAWAVVIAAMAPIPYKFVSISAGAFRINPAVFLAASVAGRAKRFMVEGLLIYYYGPAAMAFLESYSAWSLAAIGVAGIAVFAVMRRRQNRTGAAGPVYDED